MYEPQVFMVNSGYGGCNYVRIHQPFIYNGYRTDQSLLSEKRKDIGQIKDELMGSDVVVFHRAEEPEYHDLAKLLKKDGKKIVMDNDDTFRLTDNHPLANWNPDGSKVDHLQRRSDNLDEFMGLCDLVTTSTEVLAKEYREINPNVIVIPNQVDPNDWDEPKRNETDKVRIGLVGSVAMEYDYLHLKDFIRELSERDDVEICMFGLGDKEHRAKNPQVTKVFKDEYEYWDSIKKEHIPWCPVHLYPETLNSMKLDIMLIPRKDNYFNRCKSNLKFLEASMCEIPVVAQSFKDSPYEEITPDIGVLIKDNKDWQAEVNKLIDDKELRRNIGKKAKEYVIKNYNIEDNAHRWADAYKTLFI